MQSDALMDIVKARGFNKFLVFLIVLMAAFLIVIVSLLTVPLVDPGIHFISVLSSAVLIMLSLPLSLYLYMTRTDPEQKELFLGILLNSFFLFISGIFWYILPGIFSSPWLVPAGKIISVLAYLPLMVIFYRLFKARQKKSRPKMNAFILLFGTFGSLAIVLFSALNYSAMSDEFSVVIYIVSLILDIAVLSLGIMLAFVFMENQLRYLISIPISYYIFCMAGDTLSLLGFLGAYDTLGYTQYLYDLMIIVPALGLLIYALSNIEVMTVEEVNKKLYDTKSLMSDLVLQSPDAIGIFDVNGDYVMANPAFVRFTRNGGDKAAATLNIFRDADQLIRGSGDRVSRLKQGETAVYEGVSPGMSPPKYYSVKIFPTFNSEGTVTSYIAMMSDITDRKCHEEELRMAKNEAELYLDLMSHDINNMGQIAMGFLELAQYRPGLDEGTKELISRPMEALESSANLIRNVKKLQQLKDTGGKLHAVDVGRALREVIPAFTNMPGRDIRIDPRLNGDCRVMANGLINDVFTNLIGNSIKHSKGPITITVQMDKVEENRVQYCRVRIEDDGPGIPDKQKSLLFSGFLKGSPRAGDKGLGLYLVRALVETYHGQVSVEDRVPGQTDKGSRFVVMLPAIT